MKAYKITDSSGRALRDLKDNLITFSSYNEAMDFISLYLNKDSYEYKVELIRR